LYFVRCEHRDRQKKDDVKRSLIVAGAAAAVLAAGGAGAAFAFTGGDDGEQGLSGPEADRAIAAALNVTGGGTATAVERDAEKGATYEVEVRKPDRTTVDVRLDANYGLVAVDSDSEQAE
jgi:uncharacterized membrane protein YkoI